MGNFHQTFCATVGHILFYILVPTYETLMMATEGIKIC